MQVLTASHIHCTERWETLQECIESVWRLAHQVGFQRHIVGISCCRHAAEEFKDTNGIDIEEACCRLEGQYTSGWLSILRNEPGVRKSQFQHMRALVEHTASADDSVQVMFIDDDDVLVGPPQVGFKSKQYMLRWSDWAPGKKYSQFREYYPTTRDKSVSDFSGTTCTLGELRSFLNTKEQDTNVDDLKFLVYLNRPDCPPEVGPFVARRTWNGGPFWTWPVGYTCPIDDPASLVNVQLF